MKLINQFAQGKLIYFNTKCNLAVYESSHYRWLMLNNACQSIMLKRQPNKLVLPHHYLIMMPLLTMTPNHVTILGLGGGNLNRFLLQLNPETALTTIEVSDEVINTYFDFFWGADLTNAEQIISADVDTYISNQVTTQCDWLIYDIYTSSCNQVLLERLISNFFHDTTKRQLFTINLAGASNETINRILTQLKSICQTSCYTIAYHCVPHYNNTIIHILPAQQSDIPAAVTSSLPPVLFKRWQNIWQHRLTV
ncbi:hypothetical protein [Thalassotalea fusca]